MHSTKDGVKSGIAKADDELRAFDASLRFIFDKMTAVFSF